MFTDKVWYHISSGIYFQILVYLNLHDKMISHINGSRYPILFNLQFSERFCTFIAFLQTAFLPIWTYLHSEKNRITRFSVYVRTHTGEKTYICRICGKYFRRFAVFFLQFLRAYKNGFTKQIWTIWTTITMFLFIECALFRRKSEVNLGILNK